MIFIRSRKGFSLVELMVVISIIGILMAVGAVSFITAQRKARDSSRRSDMRATQEAMEQYYTENGEYPTSSNCDELYASATFAPGGRPVDPRPSQTYDFSCDITDGSGYCICAELENELGNSSALPTLNAFNCTFGSTAPLPYFCVTNQQ